MLISVVSALRSSPLDSPYGAPEDGPGEVFNIISEAAVIGHTIESEGEDTGRLHAIPAVPKTEKGISSADLGRVLSDVPLPSQTVLLSLPGGELHVVLGGNPGQVAGDLRVN